MTEFTLSQLNSLPCVGQSCTKCHREIIQEDGAGVASFGRPSRTACLGRPGLRALGAPLVLAEPQLLPVQSTAGKGLCL